MCHHLRTLAILVCALPCLAQHDTTLSQPDVVAQLLPEGGIPTDIIVPPESRQKIIRELKAAKRTASAQRAQQVAFLFAALNVDYERNRDYLLHVMTGCDYANIRFDCDDMTGFYLIYLFEHDHSEILAPLIRANLNNYDAAGSEGLGAYFDGLVQKSPEKFLQAIAEFTPSDQSKACYSAGAADGGGMGREGLMKARKKLRKIGSNLALRCLRQIELANRPD